MSSPPTAPSLAPMTGAGNRRPLGAAAAAAALAEEWGEEAVAIAEAEARAREERERGGGGGGGEETVDGVEELEKRQEEEIRRELASYPAVGEVEGILVLEEEYRGNERYEGAVASVVEEFSHIRRCRGGGDGFFRAFVFSLLEYFVRGNVEATEGDLEMGPLGVPVSVEGSDEATTAEKGKGKVGGEDGGGGGGGGSGESEGEVEDGVLYPKTSVAVTPALPFDGSVQDVYERVTGVVRATLMRLERVGYETWTLEEFQEPFLEALESIPVYLQTCDGNWKLAMESAVETHVSEAYADGMYLVTFLRYLAALCFHERSAEMREYMGGFGSVRAFCDAEITPTGKEAALPAAHALSTILGLPFQVLSLEDEILTSSTYGPPSATPAFTLLLRPGRTDILYAEEHP